ncbi:MAG TPA: acyl-CoA dehydrogenase family protein [Acidimicrobiales bacterium]|nr:acyl-CoA dehydrogenase family protein [Acidimicrobiales bacterium]
MLPDYAEFDQAIGLDWYEVDPNLRQLLDRHLTDDKERAQAEELVGRFGPLVGRRVAARADETDRHGPQLKAWDKWGMSANEVVHHPTWLANKADLVRAGYTSNRGSAIVAASLNYLACQAETALICALGMTTAAADIVERYAPEAVRADIVGRLTTDDPDEAWEGGMFLTERQGGSDVGANTTRAVQDGDEWLLYGEKFFCSNIDADVFIVLARPDGAPEGSRGLGTFIVPRNLPDGSPNGFTMKRLKPKLGTVGVPTGEVFLEGARAWLAGSREQSATGDAARDGRGINRMMEMVNGSRFGVAVMGLGIHRRSFLEGAIYAAHRRQFGSRIDQYPLVRETLVDMLVDLEANIALTYECAAATRNAVDEDEGRLLRRILVPLAKMKATRSAIGAASNALELFGGNGYMEDWPMARQLRDAQCHTIWEGTENILCIDVRRAMRGEGAHDALLGRVERSLDGASGHEQLAGAADAVASGLKEAREASEHMLTAPDDLQLLHARRFSFLLAEVTAAGLLLDEAAFELGRDGNARKAAVATRYARQHLVPQRARGILDDDRTAIDLYEPIVRYGAV